MFDTLVWHYTATFTNQDIGAKEIDVMHRARGWSGIGYHHVVRLDGRHEVGRPESKIGSHVKNQNTGKLGMVTVGGLLPGDPDTGRDTRTPEQIRTQIYLTREALRRYPSIKRVVGHKDLAATQCPGYDVAKWWSEVIATPSPTTAPSPAQPAPPAATYPFLKKGSTGKGVIMLQWALNACGPSEVLKVDGQFGPRTEQAVKQFQMLEFGSANGMVGNTTWAALMLRGGLS